jgi:hypothetical protein
MKWSRRGVFVGLLGAALFAGVGGRIEAQEGRAKKEPKPKKPPRGATILFGGKSTEAWVHRGNGEPCAWEITSEGNLKVTAGKPDILSKEKWGDFDLHLEFKIPLMPDKKGQERGNSGVYLHGLYEIQILDAYNNETYKYGGCGAIYEQKDPDKNACKPPEEWQTYDIQFRAPRFGADGKITEKPVVSVVWNGVKVHDKVEINHPTRASLDTPPAAEGPIMLQNHGTPVQYRNIWLVPKKSK